MSKLTKGERAFRAIIAQAIINTAERPAALRGPWVFDEASLQRKAAQAREFITPAGLAALEQDREGS